MDGQYAVVEGVVMVFEPKAPGQPDAAVEPAGPGGAGSLERRGSSTAAIPGFRWR